MDPSWTYDTDIDAMFRKMEKDPAERPSEEDYLSTMQKMTMADRAEHVAWMYELTRFHNLPPGTLHRAVLAAERDLVATLGYRLSGPTAYTFVDHFTRHDDEEDTHHDGVAVMRALAHHIADVTLLDYRCALSLPSAVAASAVLLARRVVDSAVASSFSAVTPSLQPWREELLEMTGYTVEGLADVMDAIYEMHEVQGVWPGCALMMANCGFSYCLPPRCC
ncbi:hypothetical protein QOZ80_2BG0190030 [Eleusine coracana subsp. coracana]|nr:hypothetical protein QOZ80_2BG0190030 [Eleusine coracana subsp. coracana]